MNNVDQYESKLDSNSISNSGIKGESLIISGLVPNIVAIFIVLYRICGKEYIISLSD